MSTLIDIALLTMLALTAVALVRLHNLFTVAMLSGIYSLISASLFMLMDAVDVAFTEAAVGAGITTVLFLGTLSITGKLDEPEPRHPVRSLFIVLVTGGALIGATLDMPHYGDPNAPVHQHVAPRYVEDSLDEVGPENVVTSVLASYRGYDTLGETVVVFTAAVGVLLLIGSRPKREEEDES